MKTSLRNWKHLAAGICAAATSLTLAGCGAGSTATSAPSPVTAAAMKGTVMGGQQPVANVTLQLYEASSAGYGTPSIKLGGTATTNAAGNFNFPSYTCDPGSQVYLVGTGGQPIAATANTPAVSNDNLALMVGLGSCGGSGLNNFVNLNELTTVVTVWALAPFMTDAQHVSTSANNVSGLSNAFAVINQLVNTANGKAPGPMLPAGTTLPTQEMNALANILANCVNSAGGSAGDTTDGLTNGTPCGKLFYLSTTPGSMPSDTIAAAINIAKSPAQNVAKLNYLQSATPAFSPSLNVNTAPGAWTIAMTYTGGGINAPSSVAVDQSGNIWLTNPGKSSVTKLDPTGAPLSGTGGFTPAGLSSPNAIAIDQNGSAWVANSGNNTVSQLSPSGTAGTIVAGNGLNAPHAVAVDAVGSIFVANTSSISSFTNAGNPLNSPIAAPATPAPTALAIDPK